MMYNPPHPGEILRDEVIVPLGLSVTEAAQRLAISRVAARFTPPTCWRGCFSNPDSRL